MDDPIGLASASVIRYTMPHSTENISVIILELKSINSFGNDGVVCFIAPYIFFGDCLRN